MYKVHCGQIDAAVILNIVGGCEIRMRTVLLPPPPPDIDGGIVASNVMLPVALLTTGAVPLTQYVRTSIAGHIKINCVPVIGRTIAAKPSNGGAVSGASQLERCRTARKVNLNRVRVAVSLDDPGSLCYWRPASTSVVGSDTRCFHNCKPTRAPI